MHTILYRRPEQRQGSACRVVAVGDIMLSGEVGRRHPPGTAASDLFGDVVGLLRSGDIVFGNLETPLCDGAPGRDLFRGQPGMAAILADAGFNVLSLANNHIMDYGPEALRQCATALLGQGIAVLGAGLNQAEAGRPVVLERHGLRIGMLGFGRTLQEQKNAGGPGFMEWDERAALDKLRRLRQRVDCVVVSLHIGMMWIDYPKPAFKEIGDRLVDAGADVVLMHHAHVLQGYGVRSGRLAIYNLGNFIADIDEGETESTPVPERQRESGLFIIELDRGGVVEAGITPLWITDDFTVSLADAERAASIVARLERISEDIRLDRYHREYARQRGELNAGNLLESLWVKVRKGRWGELARNVLRVRPEHIGMIGRFGARKLGALLRRHT